MEGEEKEKLSLSLSGFLSLLSFDSAEIRKDKYVKFEQKITQLKRHQTKWMDSFVRIYMNDSNVVVETSSLGNVTIFLFIVYFSFTVRDHELNGLLSSTLL